MFPFKWSHYLQSCSSLIFLEATRYIWIFLISLKLFTDIPPNGKNSRLAFKSLEDMTLLILLPVSLFPSLPFFLLSNIYLFSAMDKVISIKVRCIVVKKEKNRQYYYGGNPKTLLKDIKDNLMERYAIYMDWDIVKSSTL